MTRIAITRHDPDGTVVDGTAHVVIDGAVRVHDFRDLDGNPLPLPAGATYDIALDDIGVTISEGQ